MHPQDRSPLAALLTRAARLPKRPIVAVVAGSGQVARCAIEGGADLLMTLSAGYFRNAGAGSLASAMPYGNANQLTERLLVEQILPRRGRTPVIAGVLATDPVYPVSAVLRRFQELGVEGVTNWPAMGFIDGTLRSAFEAEGLGLDAEVDLIRQARQLGLAAFGFALEPEAAGRFADAGADALILDLGLTRWLEDIREHRDQLQQAIARLQDMLSALERASGRPLLLGFGGPVTTAEDFEQLARQCEIDGFAGGSCFERLPVEEVVTATVRRFKGVAIRPAFEPAVPGSGGLVGASHAMKEVIQLIHKVAPYDVNVCIEGETGTGKELVATLLHRHSARSHKPFITLNCGAIPETLLESELFGHERGAFTGAHRQRIGKFELANRGTLFLDEIADLSAHGQVALLRAIQQREITRVGGEATIPVDTRIITASHPSLSEAVKIGRFRADLFYRLNHLTIHLPPLRERQEDIPVLTESILAVLRVQLNRPITGVSGRFLEKLCRSPWLGNVRELEHVLRQAALLEETAVLNGRFFHPPSWGELIPGAGGAGPGPRGLEQDRSRSERAGEAVAHAGGNKSVAAANLGISRKTLYAWLRDEGTAERRR
ncbi:MAG: phosphoenolpyruvate hydrolase family protein [Verrucomicrobiota bacterium]